MFDLQALLYSARQENWLVSPYFVPGEAGTLLFAGQAARGMDVRVLTNSLAATDVAVVHAGYLRYRLALLAAGVHLYELRRGSAESTYRMGSSGASLHTKAVVVDGQRGFIGSFNFDPRSAQLNTEMGVLFEPAPLAAEVRAMVVHAMQPTASYELQRDAQGGLRWLSTPDAQGTREVFYTEPDTDFWQRTFVRVLSWLPIESQL
jgi:putative cardiolipin synthase